MQNEMTQREQTRRDMHDKLTDSHSVVRLVHFCIDRGARSALAPLTRAIEHLCASNEPSALLEAHCAVDLIIEDVMIKKGQARIIWAYLPAGPTSPSQLTYEVLRQVLYAYRDGSLDVYDAFELYRQGHVGDTRDEQRFLCAALADPNLWPLVQAAFDACSIDWRDVAAEALIGTSRALRHGLIQQWCGPSVDGTWPFETDWRSMCGLLDDDESLCARLAAEQMCRHLGDALTSAVLLDSSTTLCDVICQHYDLMGAQAEVFSNQARSGHRLSVRQLVDVAHAALHQHSD